ncbi:MAG: hypothetical protein L7S67_04300 [Flavobacteriales bacterium]|nr:hypothetical protein [Flavobacteriales bacterium]
MELNYPGHSCFLLVSGELRAVNSAFISSNPLATDVSLEVHSPAHVLWPYGHENHVTDAQSVLGRHWTADGALLPMEGAFNKGAEYAPAAVNMQCSRQVVGMHDDTFPPIASDREVALSTVRDAGVELHLSGNGAVLETVN